MLGPGVAAALPAPHPEWSDQRVEILAPPAAVPLTAGSTALLEWAPLPGLTRLPARQEWEAFLSLDGGKSYSIRITPHLDSDLRRTLWEVPALPSPDVRLLLRFGDERRETVIELPQRFTIVAAPAASASLPDPLNLLNLLNLQSQAPHMVLAPGRGEAARPGDQGVASWVEGSRRGAGRRQVVAAAADVALRDALRQPDPAQLAVALTVRPAETRPPAIVRGAGGGPPWAIAKAPAPSRPIPPPPIDTMLQTSRLNE